jgi:hypothetical protein
MLLRFIFINHNPIPISIGTIPPQPIGTLKGTYSPKIRAFGYITKKRARAASLVDEIVKKVKTSTSSDIFNAYVAQVSQG